MTLLVGTVLGGGDEQQSHATRWRREVPSQRPAVHQSRSGMRATAKPHRGAALGSGLLPKDTRTRRRLGTDPGLSTRYKLARAIAPRTDPKTNQPLPPPKPAHRAGTSPLHDSEDPEGHLSRHESTPPGGRHAYWRDRSRDRIPCGKAATRVSRTVMPTPTNGHRRSKMTTRRPSTNKPLARRPSFMAKVTLAPFRAR